MQTQKYALVTGGNRGIGLEVCRKLVQHGKPVLLTARSAEAAQRAAQQLRGSTSVDVQAFALEAGDANSISQLVKNLGQYDQKIDLLVNNAAILVRGAWDESTYNETMAVNVGPLSLTQQLTHMMPQGALVIMVSSGNGQSAFLSPDYLDAVRNRSDLQQLHGLPATLPFNPSSPQGQLPPQLPPSNPGSMAPTYSVAKALMNRAVQLLAAPGSALQQRGINVAAVTPGWCKTDMGSEAAERTAEQGADSVLYPWLNWQPQLNGSFTRDGTTLDW